MEKEILDRLEKIEEKVSREKKDFWEIVQILTPILIPVAIAFVGWYFTNQHNHNQLELQKRNSENQQQIALINSTVGQSSLIKDFLPHLNSSDSTERNIALIAILYAAPAPGKEIVDKIAQSDDAASSKVANDALKVKRNDLVNNLFSFTKSDRLVAANEITQNWRTDPMMVHDMLTKTESCLTNTNEFVDCQNGVINSIIVLRNFPIEVLKTHEPKIRELIALIPEGHKNTLSQSSALLEAMQ